MDSFLEHSCMHFKKAIFFELDQKNCEELGKNIEDQYDKLVQDKICIINKGVSDQSKEIFYAVSTSSSHIEEKGEIRGSIVKIDQEIPEEKITLLKMDIEGAELSALKGATQIIKIRQPDLAICVYHKLKDFWEIPLYIKSICPEYKIYLRHHSQTQIETVCYAVI